MDVRGWSRETSASLLSPQMSVLLSHVQDASLGSCIGVAEGSGLVEKLFKDIAFPTIPSFPLSEGPLPFMIMVSPPPGKYEGELP